MKVKSVLFLCTGNACRSQMAEGWGRHLLEGIIQPYSAGVIKHGLDQRAVQVMAEAGADISGQVSKTLDELPTQEFDAVITLCDSARESCPYFPGGVIRLHQSFDDPPVMAAHEEDAESALRIYRRVRDEIREFVQELPNRIG